MTGIDNQVVAQGHNLVAERLEHMAGQLFLGEIRNHMLGQIGAANISNE